MREWKPMRGSGRGIAAVLLLLALAGAIALLLRLVPRFLMPPEAWPITPRAFLEGTGAGILLVLAGWFGYRLLAALTLTYTLDRNGIYISWIGNRAVIPLAEVQQIALPPHEKDLPALPLRNIGYYWGHLHRPNQGTIDLYTTLPPARSVLIYAAHGIYAIAPHDPQSFAQEFEQRRQLGATQNLRPSFSEGRLFFAAFWNDPVIRSALLTGLAVVLLLLGWLSLVYAGLPPTIPLGFDAAGTAIDLRPRHQILWVPLLGITFALLNTSLSLLLFRHQRTVAHLLQLATVPVLLLFAVATVVIATY